MKTLLILRSMLLFCGVAATAGGILDSRPAIGAVKLAVGGMLLAGFTLSQNAPQENRPALPRRRDPFTN